MEALPDFSLLAVALPGAGPNPLGSPDVAPSFLASLPPEGGEADPVSAFQALLPALLQAAESGQPLPAPGKILPLVPGVNDPAVARLAENATQNQFFAAAPAARPGGGADLLPGSAADLLRLAVQGQAAPAPGPPDEPARIAGQRDALLQRPVSIEPARESLPVTPQGGAAETADPDTLLPATLPRSALENGARADRRGATARPTTPGAVEGQGPRPGPEWTLPTPVANAEQPIARSEPLHAATQVHEMASLEIRTPTPTTAGAVPHGWSPASPDSAARPVAPLPDLPVAPSHPRFGAEVLQRVQVMVEDGIGQARLRLNPPELGAVEIRIAVTDDRATVHFSATQATARDALEAGLPRLRELLESAGLALAEGQVSHRDSPPHQHGAGASHDDLPAGPEPASADMGGNDDHRPIVSTRRIDLYA